MQRGVAHQRARKELRLGQDLEAVADAKHRHAAIRLLSHRAHDRRMRGHRAGAQIIAIGEAARQHDQIHGRKLRLPMPDHHRLHARDLFERHRDVAVAIRSREYDDSAFHGHPLLPRARYFSSAALNFSVAPKPQPSAFTALHAPLPPYQKIAGCAPCTGLVK